MTPPVHSRRVAVRDDLFGDLDAVTERILRAVRTEIPAYDALEPGQWSEVQEIAAWGVSRVLDAWVHDTRLDEDDLGRFRGIGAARGLDGRPIAGVLRAYRVAGSEVTDMVAERARGRLEVDDAIALARLWMASIDALSEAVHEGWSAATERIDDPDRARGDLLRDLLLGRHATTSAVRARARQLDLPLPAAPTLVVARLDTHDVPAWVAAVRSGLVADQPGTLLHTTHGGRTVALTGTLSREVRTVLRRPNWHTVLQPTRLDAVARAHRLAVNCLDRAPAHAWRSRGVLEQLDVHVLARLSRHDEDNLGDIASEALHPLLRHGQALSGLRAHLAEGNAVDAAHALDCHPQTLRHRLRRVTALTGRDPHAPWDRFVLEVALTALENAHP